MAFQENSKKVSSFPAIEDEDSDGFHKIRNSLSRLSICTNSVYNEEATKVRFFTAESFDGGAEADGEVSDDGGRGKENVQEWDSDKETPKFYSLPASPSRRRQRREKKKKEKRRSNGRYGINGESDGGVREGLTVLTRAKGGENSMRMGLDEVKACRELGFDLEVPGRISVSTGSNFDTQTSSGGNSPIATWRISSPGDDPKEVKARLKVWAQAVALASSSRQV